MSKITQAGTVPFRVRSGQVEFLLVTSQNGNWIFPKGIVEPGETHEEAAAKETREEAGVQGSVLPGPVGTYEHRKWLIDCVVHLYLLEYLQDCDSWEEKDIRRRRWCSYDEAAGLIKKAKVRRILKASLARLRDIRPELGRGP